MSVYLNQFVLFDDINIFELTVNPGSSHLPGVDKAILANSWLSIYKEDAICYVYMLKSRVCSSVHSYFMLLRINSSAFMTKIICRLMWLRFEHKNET